MRRVLLLGADGFIGRQIAFYLRAAGWDVLASARRTSRLQAMGFATLKADLADPQTHAPRFWAPHLTGRDVVNAAGLLRGAARRLEAVQVLAPRAIYASMSPDARGVLISATGIDHGETDFARAKCAGEAEAGHNITILRPGLVLADTSYGGSSLLRAMAAMPLATPVLGDGAQDFTPLHAADLAGIVAACLERAPGPGPFEVGGPEHVDQRGMISALRSWLGLRPVPVLHIPMAVARTIGRLGDLMRLGPISATAVEQLQHGVVADGSKIAGLVEVPLRPFSEFVNARPAGSQDLWHARLYLMRPLVRIVLAGMWLVSGLIGLGLSPEAFLPLMPKVLPDSALIAMARAGGIADLAIAAALVRGWRPRLMAGVQAALVGAYTIAFTALAPGLWLLPLGGLLKNLPILALIAITSILEEER